MKTLEMCEWTYIFFLILESPQNCLHNIFYLLYVTFIVHKKCICNVFYNMYNTYST